MKRLLLVVASLTFGWPAHAAFCPCYSSTSATNPFNCGVPEAPGTNPTMPEWQALIEASCAGPADPRWGNGPTIAPIGQGCGSSTKVPARFPCELVEAIAMQETRWIQFCEPTEPADKIG